MDIVDLNLSPHYFPAARESLFTQINLDLRHFPIRPGRFIPVNGNPVIERHSMMQRFMRWCFNSLVRAHVTRLFQVEWTAQEPLLRAQAGQYSLFGDAVNAQLIRVKEHMDRIANISAEEIMQLKERNLADRKTILKQNERIAELEIDVALLQAKQIH